MKYYKHIDGLRALAVIAVLFAHLDFPAFRGGYVGVDVFFVISGFLITNIIIKELEETKRFDFINFYTRRARRIMPALSFVLIISFILGVWLLDLAKFHIFGGSLVSTALSFSNVYFYKQASYFDILSQSNPLLHTWSLGVEEQFYIFWPVILLITFRFFREHLLKVLFLLFIISFINNIYDQDNYITALYYLVQYRAFEFLIGAFLIWILKIKIKDNYKKELLCALGILFILYPIFTYKQDTLFPSYNALLPCIGAALLIYAGEAKYLGFLFRNEITRFIGLISYSLYLVHWPLIVFIKTYNEDVGQLFELSLYVKIIIFFVSICVATFMYFFIEQPFRKNIPKNKEKQIFLLFRWLIVVIFFIVLGFSIYCNNGWAWRAKSPEVIETISDISNYNLENWGGADFKEDYIHIGKTTYPNIIIMGDSHAGMLDFGIIKEIAIPYDLTIFTVAHRNISTLLLPGVIRLYPKSQKSFDYLSKKSYSEAITALKKSKDSVLIYSTWLSGQLKMAGSIETHKSFNIDTLKIVDYNDYELFINALDKLRADMGKHKLILIGDFPGALNYKPLECISELKWFKFDKKCNSEDKASENMAAINVNGILKEYAKRYENVYFINPYEVFCEKGYCKNIDSKGKSFYSDSKYEESIMITNSHLSKIGSLYFAKHIRDQLIRIINEPIANNQ
ncbi:acyltransferase family protein [Pseudofrancisella aestuarii]|uniref:Acyltransferase family protein n=1 Tax=Pseudofrancisella aestuarii TaxID=2670347 RepID=A0ABV9TE25_9GAMM|nr:acyltransferase family protein [Pseudofrancisella aestuarii]